MISVQDSVFAAPRRDSLVHQVVLAYRAGAGGGTKAQKTRADVRGGGAKPWRQKGTGRARAGSRRSPLWRGGGVVFAAKPRDVSHKVNRKMYRGAMCSVLSTMVSSGALKVIPDFSVEEAKTKLALQKLHGLELDISKPVLIVLPEPEENALLAVRNLPTVAVAAVSEINPYNILAFNCTVMTEAAVREVEEWLS